MEQSKKYYRYGKKHLYPFFLRVGGEFAEAVSHHLEQMGFSLSTEADYKKVLQSKAKYRLVNMTSASHQVIQQLGQPSKEIDHYGSESVTPGLNYEVYRYKGAALLVFSDKHSIWDMGLKLDLTIEKDQSVFKIVLSRMMGLAMANLGILSFWAVPVDEGVVIMRQQDANAETVMVDLNRQVMLTIEGEKPLAASTQLFRLDSSLHSKPKLMPREEVLSFLCSHLNYFNYAGVNQEIKALLTRLAVTYPVYKLAVESFKPRTDLSMV
jgi:hypothetical protein